MLCLFLVVVVFLDLLLVPHKSSCTTQARQGVRFFLAQRNASVRRCQQLGRLIKEMFVFTSQDKYCVLNTTFSDGTTFLSTAIQDTITFLGEPVTTPFAYVYNESPNFSERSKKDKVFYLFCFTNSHEVFGVLGLGASDPSIAPVLSFFDSLVSQNKLNNSFSICLGPDFGHLVVGGLDSKYMGNYSYVIPTLPNSYQIKITGFMVNGTCSL